MKRERQKGGDREVIFGVNTVTEALLAGRRKVYSIMIKSGAADSKQMRRVIDIAGQKKIPVEFVDIAAVVKAAGSEGHQGIAALASLPAYANLDRLIERSLSAPRSPRPALAVLDGVMDPRNLGAIIRSAAAFGFDGVIIPRDRAASYTPAAAKASAGTGERMSICRVVNIAETVRRLRDEGFEVVALDLDTEEEFKKAPQGPVAIVLGGEGVGVRPLVRKRCSRAARIPMSADVESLNVASAAAVAFFLVHSS